MIGWWRRLDGKGRTAASTVVVVALMASLAH